MEIELTPEVMLSAYANGVFPMADEWGQVQFYSADPRAILPLEQFHVSRSLSRTIRQGRFQVTVNQAFDKVVELCARPSASREERWINPQMVDAYMRLQALGFAYSVESWTSDGRLAGGLFGVTIGGLFAGESMFTRRRDASKVALSFLVKRLQERGFSLLDVQIMTPHLARMGATEVSDHEYQDLLSHALSLDVVFDQSQGHNRRVLI